MGRDVISGEQRCQHLRTADYQIIKAISFLRLWLDDISVMGARIFRLLRRNMATVRAIPFTARHVRRRTYAEG